MTALSALLLVLMLVCAAAALAAPDLLASLILFGVFSFLTAAFYAAVGALDVSFTEAALGAVIATVFFVSAIHRSSPEGGREKGEALRWLAPGVLLASGLALLWAAGGLPPLGSPASPASLHVSPRYIAGALEETGAKNMVTAVIVDYRGYDTLGETTVIFTAGMACLIVLSLAAGKGRRSLP